MTLEVTILAKVIAITNQKGGVGKTTTCSGLCGGLVERGYRVLAIDLDPQGNLSFSLGVEADDNFTVYDLFKGNCDIREAILTGGVCDVIPSNILLSGVELELTGVGREYVLREQLEEIKDEYDYIIIDCPPSLSMLTINALTAAQSVLIPIQCEYYALEGVTALMNTVQRVKKGLNPALEIEGVLLTMLDGRTNLGLQVVQEVKKHFKGKVFATTIPRNVRLGEAPSYGLPIHLYDRRSTGAEAYLSLSREVIARNRC